MRIRSRPMVIVRAREKAARALALRRGEWSRLIAAVEGLEQVAHRQALTGAAQVLNGAKNEIGWLWARELEERKDG